MYKYDFRNIRLMVLDYSKTKETWKQNLRNNLLMNDKYIF